MGGNRRHQPINILVVWFLTGMWHGASWNFIIWGVYFGIIVMLEKYTLLRIINYIPRLFLHIYSMLLVIVGWGIFYFDDFQSMLHFFRSFFGIDGQFTDFISQSALTDHFWLWIVALLFCMPIRRWLPDHVLVRLALSLVVLVLSVALLVGATNNAFIYTRF